MTQVSVAAGSSTSVTIAAGSRLLISGQGVYRIGPRGSSQRPTVDELIDSFVTVGPFEDSCTVQIWATGSGATYETVAPTDGVDLTGRPLVSQVGNDGSVTIGGVTLYPITALPWASFPAASTSENRAIRVSNYGNKPVLMSDGSNWLPMGGAQVWKSQAGSIASPISSFTGVTSSLFTIDQPVFPGGLLVPTRTIIEIDGIVRRSGANGTATLNIHFGTAKTSADPTVYAFTLGATNLLDQPFSVRLAVQGINAVSATNWIARGGAGSASVVLDKSTNINTAADMGISIGVASANAADSFALLQLTTRLLG